MAQLTATFEVDDLALSILQSGLNQLGWQNVGNCLAQALEDATRMRIPTVELATEDELARHVITTVDR